MAIAVFFTEVLVIFIFTVQFPLLLSDDIWIPASYQKWMVRQLMGFKYMR
jgi:hypothetical protein